jgi:hypothetical protein
MQPSPVYIDPKGQTAVDGTEWVYLARKDWTEVGKYIYGARSWMRAAGPCIKAKGSDLPAPGNGVMGNK